MVLLKPNCNYKKIGNHRTLHSTMVLLKPPSNSLKSPLYCTLHSTMVLLKLKKFAHLEELERHFTFHYGLIKTQ